MLTGISYKHHKFVVKFQFEVALMSLCFCIVSQFDGANGRSLFDFPPSHPIHLVRNNFGSFLFSQGVSAQTTPCVWVHWIQFEFFHSLTFLNRVISRSSFSVLNSVLHPDASAFVWICSRFAVATFPRMRGSHDSIFTSPHFSSRIITLKHKIISFLAQILIFHSWFSLSLKFRQRSWGQLCRRSWRWGRSTLNHSRNRAPWL